MLRRILVALDRSPAAQSALSIASSIACITKSELWGLFVVNDERFARVSLPVAIAENLTGTPIISHPLPPDEMLAETERADSEAETLRNVFDLSCRQAAVEGRFFVERGIPTDLILDFGRASDLIVLGAKGEHSGMPLLEQGSTVHTLIASTTRPVLVVPDEPIGESSIVVAYDESMPAERALRFAAEIADITDLFDIHLVTVTEDEVEGRRVQKRAIEYLQAYDLEVTAKILQGVPHEAIAQYCRAIDASIVAIGATGGGGVFGRLFGSTASYLLTEVDEVAVLLSN